MVITGCMILLEERLDLLAGRRVGLVSHAAAVTPQLTTCLDALLERGVQVRAVFAPEHGYDGAAVDGEQIDHRIHQPTGMPVYSLYGVERAPAPNQLAELDALVIDLQDSGIRFSSYLRTLQDVLRSAAEADLPVFVLDRPNPINGLAVEGPLVSPEVARYSGSVPVPICHGMTLGELALLMNKEMDLKAALTIIPMRGWQRAMWFDQTGLPWAQPSPGLPHLSAVVLQPGTGLVQGTNLSEGRGTALPFEIAGAPWLFGQALAERLNRLMLPGVRFRPHAFRPSAEPFAGQLCDGVQLHVLDREAFRPVISGLHLLTVARGLALEEFQFLPGPGAPRLPEFDLLVGDSGIRARIESGQPVDDLPAAWEAGITQFLRDREPYLLYR